MSIQLEFIHNTRTFSFGERIEANYQTAPFEWIPFNEVIKTGFVGFYSNGSFHNKCPFQAEPTSLIAVNHPINPTQCKQLLSCLSPQVFDSLEAEKFSNLKVCYTLQNKNIFQDMDNSGEFPYLALHAIANDFSKKEDFKCVDVTVFDLTNSALLYHAERWCCWIHNDGGISPEPSRTLDLMPLNRSQEILYIIKDGSSLTIGVCHLVPDAVFKDIQEYLGYKKLIDRSLPEVRNTPSPRVNLEHVLQNPHLQNSFLNTIFHTLYPSPPQIAPRKREHKSVTYHGKPVKEVTLVSRKSTASCTAARVGLRRNSLLGQSEEKSRLIINNTSETTHSEDDAKSCTCACTIL